MTERGEPPVSFEHRNSLTLWQLHYQIIENGPQSASSIDIPQHFDSLATKCTQQKGEGPQSASSIDILQPFDSIATKHNHPLIASLPNAIDRKGRAPSQLQASIFYNPLIASLPNERGGPPFQLQVSIFSAPLMASLPNAIDGKGRVPRQFQASIFSDSSIGLLPNAVVGKEREGPWQLLTQMEFIVLSLAHERSSTVCILSPCMMLLHKSIVYYVVYIALLHHTAQSRWWFWICAVRVRTSVELLIIQRKHRFKIWYSPNCPRWLNRQTSGEIGVYHKMTPPPPSSGKWPDFSSLSHVFTTFSFNLHMLFSQHTNHPVYRYTSCSTKLSYQVKNHPWVSMEAGKWLDTDLFDVPCFYIISILHM